jgi:hypothetical protein
MTLKIENLTVESFATSGFATDQAQIGTGSESPDCIVYISDCVSCPIDAENP